MMFWGDGVIGRCVVSELKKMGEAYSGTASAARRFELAKYVLCLEFFLFRSCLNSVRHILQSSNVNISDGIFWVKKGG